MNPALLISLLLATQNPPPVQIQLTSMSSASIQVAHDGYLLVLGTASRGQPIVVYPSRPGQDGRVAGGATVKVRSWRAFSWVAVWSAQPFDGEPFTANTYWSTDSLRRSRDLAAIARRMAGDAPIEYAVASAPPVAFMVKQSPLDVRGVTFPPYAFRYLSPEQFWVRQGKFSGAPPDVCNGSVCALSVMRQLGNMQFVNAP